MIGLLKEDNNFGGLVNCTKKEFTQLKEWAKRFDKADKIKRLAYELQFLVDHNTLDRRVMFAWDKVKEVEPFPTFVDGELTYKAGRYLTAMKMYPVCPQVITIT